MRNRADLAVGIVQIAPSPASSGLTFTLESGQGDRMPPTPFDITAVPPNQLSTIDNSEILTVTDVTDDTLTVARAVSPTSAQPIAVGWLIFNGIYKADLDEKADAAVLTAHTSDTNNPHAVTKSQVALGNVDNTSDANKPVSTATQTALNGKATKLDIPQYSVPYKNTAGTGEANTNLAVRDSAATPGSIATRDGAGAIHTATATSATHATNKTYVDTADATNVSKSGDTMSGALTFSGGSEPTLGKISISQVSNVSTAGIVITNSTVGAALRAWVDGANYVRIDNSSMADKGILFNGQGTGGIGIQTTATTHSVTLGSTATGIAPYNTSDQTTNYERVRFHWSSNIYTIRTEFGGTGTGRDLLIGSLSSAIVFRYFQSSTGSYELSRSLNNSNVVHTRIAGTMTQTSGTVTGLLIAPTINQSSTAGYTALLINPTEASTGSGDKLLLNTQVGGNDRMRAYSDGALILNGSSGSVVFFNNSGRLSIGFSSTTTPTANVHIAGAATTKAALRIESGTAPTTPNDGDIWYDGTDLKMRVGGTTKTFTLT